MTSKRIEDRQDSRKMAFELGIQDAEIERLNALVAMQVEALTSVRAYLIPRVANSGTTGRTIILPEVENAISATSETVSAWQSKRDVEIRISELEKLKRQHPTDSKGCMIHSSCIDHAISELRAKGE